MKPPSHEFTDLLTSHQQRLFRYIVSLLGDADAAWDVLQETNRVVLEKRGEFAAGTNFANWALTIAQYQTMAWLRNQSRDRLLATPEIVHLLADEAPAAADGDDARVDALKRCLKKLSREHQQLVHRRYGRAEKLAEIAEQTGRSVGALKQLFFRLRGSLFNCIEHRLKSESG